MEMQYSSGVVLLGPVETEDGHRFDSGLLPVTPAVTLNLLQSSVTQHAMLLCNLDIEFSTRPFLLLSVPPKLRQTLSHTYSQIFRIYQEKNGFLSQ